MKKGTFKKLAAITAAGLIVAGSTAFVARSGGFAVEASGMKISLDLRSPTGVKVLFQRAD